MDLKEYKRIIADEKGRRSIADTLISLEKQKGWKVLKLILEDRKDFLQRQVNDIYNTDIADVEKKRIELYYINELLNMPQILAQGLISEEDQEHDEQIYE
jgi:hypothetical protein